MRYWTLEERLKQSQLIRNWKPWEQSTGAKTAEGKDKSKMNSYKNGLHTAEIKIKKRKLAELRRAFREMLSNI